MTMRHLGVLPAAGAPAAQGWFPGGQVSIGADVAAALAARRA
jgi:hypothetical protein